MTRSLVICLLLSDLTGIAATGVALLAGWGWLAAFALYSMTGSASLVAALAVQVKAPLPIRARRNFRTRKEPAFA